VSNTEDVLDASKEVYLEVNAKKIKYMFMSHYQNARQSHKRYLICCFKMWKSSHILE
jgi:hypothetical protein